jgi:putative transposase
MTVSNAADHVAWSIGITTQQFWQTGKFKQQVVARSLLCYWSVHELGESMTVPGRHLTVSTVAVRKSVRRGAKIADANGWKFINQGYPQRGPRR